MWKVFCVLLAVSCALTKDPVQEEAMKATYGEPVILGIGQKASLEDGKEIQMIRVSEDSRCPKGTQCMWAGQAGVEVKIGDQVQILILPGGGKSQPASFGDLKVSVEDVSPYPEAGVELDPTQYKATLVISH